MVGEVVDQIAGCILTFLGESLRKGFVLLQAVVGNMPNHSVPFVSGEIFKAHCGLIMCICKYRGKGGLLTHPCCGDAAAPVM